MSLFHVAKNPKESVKIRLPYAYGQDLSFDLSNVYWVKILKVITSVSHGGKNCGLSCPKKLMIDMVRPCLNCNFHNHVI